MIAWLVNVAKAVARLIAAGFSAATTFVAMIEEMFLRFFGGGGAAPAQPVPDLQTALPDTDRLTQTRDLEIGKAKAAENILKHSPEMQVKIFASLSDDERLNADLTLLTEEQVDWLMDLSDAQLKAVAQTSDRRVAAALAGEHNALTAIRSVGQPDPEEETVLAARIAAFRQGKLAAQPSNYAFN